MYEVTLKSDGFYGRVNDEIVKLDSLEFSRNLKTSLEIEDGVTIEDLFFVLLDLDEDVDFLFRSWTRGFKISPFIDDMIKESEIESDVKYIEMSWAAEVTTWEDDDCIEQSEFDIYPHMSGIDDTVKTEDVTWEKSRYYSMSISPLSSYKHLPIKLNKSLEVTTIGNNNDGFKTLLKTTKTWDIWNFVGGILSEISFHGYPEDRKNFTEDLEKMGEKINSGEEETIPMEQVMIDMLEETLERLEREEKYEKAAKVKAEIEEYKSKLKLLNNINLF